MNDLDVHLQAIVAGDVEAFAQWLSAAERPLRASLRSFAAVVDVEAVLQEALLRTWQVAPRLASDGRPNGLLRLALQMARNLALSDLRRARPEAADPSEGELQRSLDDQALGRAARPPDPLLRRAIGECRDKLPRQPRLALTERLASLGQELDAAVAARLGMRANTFLQNITRARKLLAECLKSRGINLEQELA